jgi:flagellar biosynthesis protein FlhF
MKIKHYRAPDMRQALRQVREAQGPDAVILSSRRVSGGVEVVAAVDYEAEESTVGYGAQAAGGPLPVPPPATGGGDATASRIASFGGWGRADLPAGQPAEGRGAAGQGGGTPDAADYAALARRMSQAEDLDVPGAQSNVNDELRTLRHMLETQLATLAWNDLARRSPVQVELLKQLTVLGLASDLSGELVAQLPARQELSEAQRFALALLARRIETVGERWMEQGGVVAMVGATGVGKTTLIAKLAARWVLQHGPRDVALISTDAVRIGAQEQIHTLGRLLGVPAFAIEGAGELGELLARIGDRRLILIDTAGLSQRDPRLESELAMLAQASDRLETSLVLSAAAQAGAIEEAVERFAAAQVATCVLTKLDEATSLGGALSALVRSRLPVAYVSEGQRVPEDLNPARAHQLVARAVELSRRSGAMADEDLLRRRFGAVAHALA